MSALLHHFHTIEQLYLYKKNLFLINLTLPIIEFVRKTVVFFILPLYLAAFPFEGNEGSPRWGERANHRTAHNARNTHATKKRERERSG